MEIYSKDFKLILELDTLAEAVKIVEDYLEAHPESFSEFAILYGKGYAATLLEVVFDEDWEEDEFLKMIGKLPIV